MRKYLIAFAIGALAAATPASASHVTHLTTPYDSRGACEADRNEFSNGDDFLLDVYPNFFSTTGELRSFLNRAFTCELNEGDGQWYIKDHRLEVLGSEWFQRRL